MSVNNLFLANTKPFFKNQNILSDFYLEKFNLLDYGQLDSEYHDIYDPDSRVEKYINAIMPELPEGFLFAGHGDVTRDSCGEFQGVRATKQNPSLTKEIMFNTCNKLSCPTCVRKASNVKAQKIVQKIKDYIWFCVAQGTSRINLVPKHFTFNPNYVDKHGVYHENFKADFSSMKNYHKSVKIFIKKYISPYLDGSVVFYHHHRFKDVLKTKLKEMGHFHVIGFGYLPKYDVFQNKFGFIYTNEGYLNTLSDVFRVARYELTHVIFPQKFIIRKTILTNAQMDYKRRENEWLRFLHIDTKPIERINFKESLHSFHSYFYAGYLSPYKIRYLKCKKTKRSPKGLKKMKFRRPMRNVDTNDKVYEIVDGVILRFLDKSGRYKYYPLDEAVAKRIIVNKNMQIKIFNDRLKFGKLYKTNSLLNWILIKDFRLKNYE